MIFFGKDSKQLLHGEQEFVYHSPIYSGDRITVSKKVKDIYDKKDGKLEFVITENHFVNQNNVKVAKTVTNYVIRN